MAGFSTGAIAAAGAKAVEGFRNLGMANFDVADRLPPAGARKLHRLREERDGAFELARIAAGARNEAVLEVQAARAELRRQQQGYRAIRGVSQPQEDLALEPIRERIERAEAALERATETADARQHRRDQIGPLVTRLERYLTSAGAAIQPAKLPPAPKGDLTTAVERARAKREETLVDLKATENASVSAGEARAAAIASVEALAARGRPDMLGTANHAEPLRWPHARLDAQPIRLAGEVALPIVAGPDAAALVAWLHKDTLLAAVLSDLDELVDERGLDAATRAKKLEQARAAILLAEREEEAAISAGEAAGLTILRRPDADPRAVLEIDGPRPRGDHE